MELELTRDPLPDPSVVPMSTLTHAAPAARHDAARAADRLRPVVLVFVLLAGHADQLLPDAVGHAAVRHRGRRWQRGRRAGDGRADAGRRGGRVRRAQPDEPVRQRAVLAVGLALLGAPTLLLLASDQVATIVAVSLVRGLGFGLLVVVTGALVVSLVPRERRGEAVGLSGVVSCVPAVVALPSGVWLAGHVGYALVIAVAGLSALVPLAAVPWLTGVADHRQAPRAPAPSRRSGCWPACAAASSCGPRSLFAATTVSAGSWSPSSRWPPGHRATSPRSACSCRRSPRRSAAGGPAARATGTGHGRLLIPGLVIAAGGWPAWSGRRTWSR